LLLKKTNRLASREEGGEPLECLIAPFQTQTRHALAIASGTGAKTLAANLETRRFFRSEQKDRRFYDNGRSHAFISLFSDDHT